MAKPQSHPTFELSPGAWTKVFSDPAREWAKTWQPLAPTTGMLPGGMPANFVQALVQNPLLASVDIVWNANPLHAVIPVDWSGIAQALQTVWLRSLANPGRVITTVAEFNARALQTVVETWNDAWSRWWGFGTGDAKTSDFKPVGKDDKRFAAPEWLGNPAFRMLKDLYLLASDALLDGSAMAGLDAAEQQRINFHLRQFVDATSPSLMLFSNPVALRRAMETGGVSLADGMRNLLADLREGRMSMVDATAFAPGRNLALTPGKVVHRNKLIELIQYAPSTPDAHATPLLVLPPWINKFYILDMQPKNSMVKHLVDAGFTVFLVSWKNPDAAMEDTTIEDYMHLGPLAASDVIREITGTPKVNVMGYCIAGTLLAMTLAYLAAKGDERFNAATFMVSLQDFTHVGDAAVFSDEPSVDLIEQQMLERGYLDSRAMSNMFNLLRSNDLIWSNVVNNYLLGQKPPAFDLLYWNSDGTRMARAAHGWYLRNTYVENNLIKPESVRLDGEPLDLGRITLDVYAVGAEKDHIVPWQSAWRITQLMRGGMRFVLASSGHVAGIINPPGGKGAYWAADNSAGARTPEGWRAAAIRHDGSWWKDWFAWLAARSGDRGPLPSLCSPAHPALEDAPGQYVLEK
jgi:polyhydroxyalkanoate synthase subunit PhaC